jgi:hypothetical protein
MITRQRVHPAEVTERAAGLLLVMSGAILLAAFVLWRTGDPVRAGCVLYLAGLLVFTLREAHDAWADPRPDQRSRPTH